MEGLTLCRESVRRIRQSLALPAKHPRRPPRHRRRRLPAARVGSVVLLDGSPAPWLEGRGPTMTLHGALDDATGAVLALRIRPAEDLHGYAAVLETVFTTWGLPVACYGDGTNILVRNDPHWSLEEELRGAQDPTHLGRVLVDLGIGYIRARSPQAKGRIERLWRTLQDRLVVELRLQGLTTYETATAFLPLFIADYSWRFAHPPAGSHPGSAPAPPRPAARPELSLHARGGPRQHHPPRPPLAAAPARPRRAVLGRAPPGAAGVSGRPPGRPGRGPAARRAALARPGIRLRPAVGPHQRTPAAAPKRAAPRRARWPRPPAPRPQDSGRHPPACPSRPDSSLASRA